jgi:hypothetical protein
MSTERHVHRQLSASPRSRTATLAPAALCWLVLTSLALAACGGTAARPAPSQGDVNRILTAMSDIVYQCESVATGYVAGVDEPSLLRDVDALLTAYRHVSGDAQFAIRTPTGPGERTTLRKQLTLAEGSLANADCSPGQAHRIAAALGG